MLSLVRTEIFVCKRRQYLAQIGVNQTVLPENEGYILQNQMICFVKQLNPWSEGHEPISSRIMDSLLDSKCKFLGQVNLASTKGWKLGADLTLSLSEKKRKKIYILTNPLSVECG